MRLGILIFLTSRTTSKFLISICLQTSCLDRRLPLDLVYYLNGFVRVVRLSASCKIANFSQLFRRHTSYDVLLFWASSIGRQQLKQLGDKLQSLDTLAVED